MPFFGNQKTSSYFYSIYDMIRGGWFTLSHDGVASDIKAYLVLEPGWFTTTFYFKYAIYNCDWLGDPTTLLYETDEYTLSLPPGRSLLGWFKCKFPLNIDNVLKANTKYVLAAFGYCDYPSGDIKIGRSTSIGWGQGFHKSRLYSSGYPSTITGETNQNYIYAIYCNYEYETRPGFGRVSWTP